MSQQDNDKVGKKESVLIMLCPQRSAAQRMRVTLVNHGYVTPAILIRDVDSVMEDKKEVANDRKSESDNRDHVH
jgi:hypothetical protein